MHVTVTGMGRGGTSIMGQILAAHPATELRHEQSGVFIRGLGLPEMGPLKPEELTEQHAVRLRRWAASRHILVDKDPRHVQRLGFLRRAWPEARFVYMVRDPRDLACSSIKALRKKGKSPEQWLRERAPDVAAKLMPLPEPVRIAAWWQHVVLDDLAAMDGDPAFRIVKFEHLVGDPNGTVNPLLSWLGLSPAPEVQEFLKNVADDPAVHVSRLSAGNFVPGHSRRVGRWEDEWEPEHVAQAREIAGPTMDIFGY